MRLESHHDSRSARPSRVRLRLGHKCLVTAVNTVENSNGEEDRPAHVREVAEIAQNLHCHGNSQTPRRRETAGKLSTLALTCSTGRDLNSSTVSAPSTRNFPDAVRRNAFK